MLASLNLPSTHPAFLGLSNFSYKRAAAHIVASWPLAPVSGWPAIARAGLGRLADVVRRLEIRIPKMILEAQGSSLGVYERRWLEQFYLLASGLDPCGILPLGRHTGPFASSQFSQLTGSLHWPNIRILFPTQRYIHESFVEGPRGAGCFFARPDDFARKDLCPLFAQPVSCRGDILMHAKSLVAMEDDVGWVYMGSANFTRAAWGTVAGTQAKPTLSLNNWELGVILALDSPDIEGSAWDAVPYKRPVTAYDVADTPWDVASLDE